MRSRYIQIPTFSQAKSNPIINIQIIRNKIGPELSYGMFKISLALETGVQVKKIKLAKGSSLETIIIVKFVVLVSGTEV